MSAPPFQNSMPPFPGSAPPYPGSAVPYPGSAVPYPGSAVPYPGSAVPYPGSGVPYPGSAVPYPGSGVPYPMSGPPGSGGVAQTAPAKKKTHLSKAARRWLVAGLAVVLVAAVTALVLTAVHPFKEGTKSFSANTVLPASFSYPASWKMAANGTSIAFSKDANAAGKLFSSPGTGDGWPDMADALKNNPDTVAGMYTTFQQSDNLGDTADVQKTALANLLPTTYGEEGAAEKVTVDGKSGFLHKGSLVDPGNDGATLKVWNLVLTNTDNQKVVFTFFASQKAFPGNEAKFNAVVTSMRFPA
jgi:hypothetical protein